MSKPRVDVAKVLRTYSQDLLRDYEQENGISSIAFDRGPPRENAVRKLLRERLPGRYGVGEGLVIDGHDGQSLQNDVVIYDRQRCPWIATEKAQTIWPYEFVYGVAEVKSALTEVALGEAIDKAAAFKSLKRQANEYARMPGFVSRTKPRNPPFAMVVAHTTDLDTRRILELIHQRPREQQLDVFGIIGGRVGMRCEKKPGPQIHIGVDHDAFAVLDFGDGAMAALLLITTAYLNGLHLDETADGLEYLRYLPFSAG